MPQAQPIHFSQSNHDVYIPGVVGRAGSVIMQIESVYRLDYTLKNTP